MTLNWAKRPFRTDAEKKERLDQTLSEKSRGQEVAFCMGFDAMAICMGVETQNYPLKDVARWFHLAAERLGLGAAEFANNEGSIAVLPDTPDHGVALDGRFAGWLLWKHPDGQWVTIRKLEIETPDCPYFPLPGP